MSGAEIGPFIAHCPIHEGEPLTERVYGDWPDDDQSAGTLHRVWLCPTLDAQVDENDIDWRGRDLSQVLAEHRARQERALEVAADVRWCDVCGGSRPGFWLDSETAFRCEPCGTVVLVVRNLPRSEPGDVA